jgi:hypothetical protein
MTPNVNGKNTNKLNTTGIPGKLNVNILKNVPINLNIDPILSFASTGIESVISIEAVTAIESATTVMNNKKSIMIINKEYLFI